MVDGSDRWNNTFFFTKYGYIFLILSVKPWNNFPWYSPLIVFLFEDNQWKLSSHIPKHWRRDLSNRWNCFRLLWSRFFPFCALCWLFCHIRRDVMDSWLWIDTKVWLYSRRHIVKHSIETSSWNCFYPIVSKHGTHLTHSFIMSKFLVNMRCTTLFEILPCLLACWLSRLINIILCILFTISGVITSFGRPLPMFALADRTTSIKLWHPISYCCKWRRILQ